MDLHLLYRESLEEFYANLVKIAPKSIEQAQARNGRGQSRQLAKRTTEFAVELRKLLRRGMQPQNAGNYRTLESRSRNALTSSERKPGSLSKRVAMRGVVTGPPNVCAREICRAV